MIRQFLIDICSPEMYGHAVSNEVRQVAHNILTEMDMKHDDWLASQVPEVTMEKLETHIFKLQEKIEDLNEQIMSLEMDQEYYRDFAVEVRKFMTTTTDPRASKFVEEFNAAWIGVTYG
jgi:hypothetical protein